MFVSVPRASALLAALCLSLLATPGANAQWKVAQAATTPAPVGQSAGSAAIPDQYRLNLLVRTIVIAVNQANQTGNYSVLRDLAAPGFQEANSLDKLKDIFANLRNSKFDLSPILFFNPKLVRAPAIEQNGMLRLTGFFETRPQQVEFDLLFQQISGDWRLYGIALGTKPVAAAAAPAGQGADAKKQDSKK